MIVLSVKNLAKKSVTNEVYISKDKAEERLSKLECDPSKIKDMKKGFYLEAYSYDTDSEKKLIEGFLPVARRVKIGGDDNG